MTKGRLVGPSTWALVVLAGSAAASTQDGAAQAPAPAPAAARPLTEPSKQFMTEVARAMARTALLDLRVNQSPNEDDFAITADLLRRAAETDPADAQTIRRWVQAAHASGSDDGVEAATLALIRADPGDTVAQLRLSTRRIAGLQTVEDRLAEFARLLGPAGSRLDPSVRSRLALDSALLARETGDEELFVRRLKQATQLDSTNKDAAFLAYTYFSERVADARGRFELLSNLLMADPLDASVHAQIRDLCASVGAWEGAARFHLLTQQIVGVQQQLGPNDRVASLALMWRRDGAREALNAVIDDLRAARSRQERMTKAEGVPLDQISLRKADEVRLAVPMDEFRAAVAAAAGDANALAAAMVDLGASTLEVVAVMRDPSRRPSTVDAVEAEAVALDAETNGALWRLAMGTAAPRGARTPAEIGGALPGDDPRKAALEAWGAVRDGRHADALAVSPGVLDPWLMMAHSLAHEAGGDKKKAADLARAVSRGEPLTALGSWAWWRASTLEPSYRDPDAAPIETLAKTVPTWVDSMLRNPSGFQRLVLEWQEPRASALVPATLAVRIKNLAPVPLAIGAGAPIEARLLLAARATMENAALMPMVEGEVFEIDQRLRLNPGEELRTTFAADSTALGWVLRTACYGNVSLTLRGLQGFYTTPEGGRYAAPGSLDVNSDRLTRPGLAEARLNSAQLAQRVSGAGAEELPALFTAIRAHLWGTDCVGAPDEGTPGLAEALAAVYHAWPPAVRVLALAELPNAADATAMQPFDDAASADQDPGVLPWVIVTRASLADNPALTLADASGDASLAMFAARHRARLASGQRFYATHGVEAAPTAPKAETRP